MFSWFNGTPIIQYRSRRKKYTLFHWNGHHSPFSRHCLGSKISNHKMTIISFLIHKISLILLLTRSGRRVARTHLSWRDGPGYIRWWFTGGASSLQPTTGVVCDHKRADLLTLLTDATWQLDSETYTWSFG